MNYRKPLTVHSTGCSITLLIELILTKGKRMQFQANFNRAHLMGVNFDEQRLPHAKFYQAKLQDASFIGSDLCFANFRQADLTGANLTGADVSCANFMNSVLRDASLDGVLMNWFSRELISERLRQAAEELKGEISDTLYAGYLVYADAVKTYRNCRLGEMTLLVNLVDNAPLYEEAHFWAVSTYLTWVMPGDSFNTTMLAEELYITGEEQPC